MRETGFFLSLKTRIFFPIDRQDWKGFSVPRSCSFLHWIWNCHGIGWTSTKIRLQHIQRHHRSHQVSGFWSVMVVQCVWRGRVSWVACLQLWQLWIPTTEQSLGCCTSARQTVPRHQRQIIWKVSALFIRRRQHRVLLSVWALQLSYTRGHWLSQLRAEGVFTLSRSEVAFACKPQQQCNVRKNSLCPRRLTAWLKANFIGFSHVSFCQHTLFGFLLANFRV